ncbi:MAG: riboflavin synthase [Acidimicrobiia bacterium]
MFTGIIESLGTVTAVTDSNGGRRMLLETGELGVGLEVGDSIAVNGVCLTAVEVGETGTATDIVSETLHRSNLGSVKAGDLVNLERPLRADGRFGGHIVQGHVDTTGEILRVDPEGDGRRLTIGVQPSHLRYVVEKGSITVDGVSLTVASIDGGAFGVALIPHTLSTTTLGLRHPGDLVNLEFDVLAKYVERMMERPS